MRKVARDVFIIVGITFALFISSELVLRVAFPEKIDRKKPMNLEDLAYEFNEHFLVLLKPNIQKAYLRKTNNGSASVVWKTNGHSFRGEELVEYPDIRIIVYGDSNIQARFSELQDTFPFKLEQYLKKDLDKKIEVLNAGVVGFGPDQNLIRFSREVDIYKPDLVIFHIFTDNDFGDIIRNRLFELDSNGGLIATNHKKEPDERLGISAASKHNFKDFVSSLLLVRGVRKTIKRIVDGKEETVVHKLLSVTEEEFKIYKNRAPKYFSHFADHYDLDMAIFPDASSSKIKVKLMEAVLKQAKAIATERGVEFLVLIQPSVVDLTENYKFSYKDLEKYPGYKNSNLTDAVSNVCKENNIYQINLFNSFQRNNPEELFFKGGNNHWNNRGQDLAARETESYILSNILVKKN